MMNGKNGFSRCASSPATTSTRRVLVWSSLSKPFEMDTLLDLIRHLLLES